MKAYEIATASDRMCGLIFGIADFAANLGDSRNRREPESELPLRQADDGGRGQSRRPARGRQRLPALWRKDDSPERVAELQCGLREKNHGRGALGMDGTWVIHPQQAEICQRVLYAERRSGRGGAARNPAYHEKGGGSMADPKTGEMIDEATIKIALMDLAKGAQAGMVDADELKDWSAKSRAITGYDILELMRRTV